MPHASSQSLTDHLQVLFATGTCAGLTDGELIDRFTTRGDEGAERAFEALVTRHGPMVMGVCCNILHDPSEAHDAFQATFLVLARRAGSIRQRGSVGSWLHGVAIRVAARSRASSIRRQIRDRRIIAAAGSRAVNATDSGRKPSIEGDENAALLYMELDRLPEKYRAPIVLCYLEGLTHDEAAARLSWPVGTVRSRLSRGRDTLRSRLTRRGVTAPSTLGSLAAWILADSTVSSATVAMVLPPHFATTLARSAMHFTVQQTTTADKVSAAAQQLAQGVLTTMTLKKLTIAGSLILSLGVAGLGGGTLLLRASRAQEFKKTSDETQIKRREMAVITDPPKADAIDPLLRDLLEAARLRADAQRAFYEEGRITIDRFIDALSRLKQTQLLIAKTDSERLAIRQRHVNLLKEIENREKAEVAVGRGTIADVSEARQRHLESVYDLKNSEKELAEKTAILNRLSELERKVDELLKDRTIKPTGNP